MAKKSSGKSVQIIRQGVAYVPEFEALVTIKPAVTKSESVEVVTNAGDDVMPWGENNDFPNEWELQIEADDTLTDAIEKEIDRFYGGGLEVGYTETIDNETVFVPINTPEVKSFIKSPATTYAFEQLIADYVKHRLPVAEILLNEGVAAVSALQAAHFRWQKQDKTGWINNGYYNRNWKRGRKSTSEDTTKIPVFDPLIDTAEGLKASTLKKVVYKPLIVTHRTYYPLSPAYSAKTSRFLSIKSKVIESFDSSLDNQMSPKYHIEVDVDYLAQKYGERWKKADDKEINKILEEELDEFHKMMHGAKNTGKNVISTKWIEALIKKEYSSWTITPLKGNVFEEGHLKLLNEADAHIRQSVGIDKTLQGQGNGSGMGAGSGSDKRVAFNIRMSTINRHLRPILDVFNLVMEINGLKGPGGHQLETRVITPYMQTQNEVPPSERETTQKI